VSDVFISYSRKNSAFARCLIDRLILFGKDAWVDWEGIPLTAPNWWAEIKAGIEGADSFVFILSPDSMASVVCNMELDYAIELRKRIVPLVYQDVETRDAFASIADFQPDEAMQERLAGKDPLIISRDNWQRLSHINWVFFRETDDFDAGFETLVKTVETDLDYVQAHTRYLIRAQEWQREQQRADLLLFGGEIDRAEAWLQKAEGYAAASDTEKVKVVNPLPKDLHRDYIRVSRQADRRRRRLVRSAQLSIAVLILVLIAGFVIGSSIITRTQKQAAEIEITSAFSVGLAETQAEAAMQFVALRAVEAATVAADTDRQLATATRVAEQASDGQATLNAVSTQVIVIEATVTQAAVVEHIISEFANTMLQSDNDSAPQIARMEAMIQLYPDQSMAWQMRGLVYAELGDIVQAIADYDKAIELNPGLAEVYNNRAVAKNALGDFEGAIEDYDEAIRLDPAFGAAYHNRGLAKADLKELDGAIADYDEAIRLNPESATLYHDRGLAMFNMGDFEGAVADFDESIRLDPEYAEAYNERALAKSNLNNMEGAFADYDEAIRLDPEAAIVYVNRGADRFETGDISGAIADFDEAIRLNPEYSEAYNNRGGVNLNLGRLAAAVADFDEAIRYDPENGTAYYNRGNAKRFMEDLEGALADYDEAIRLIPRFVDAYLSRGIVKYFLGDMDGSIADNDMVLRLDPTASAAYGNRGVAYYTRAVTGESDSQEADMRQALSDWKEAERLGLELAPIVLEYITEIEADLGITPTPGS
jgi:tetratricopeptide (TPR) repeat protein